MTFEDYYKLKDKAIKAGVVDSSALNQLLHLIQAKEVARSNFKSYLNEMNVWERNCAEVVEREIRRAGEYHE